MASKKKTSARTERRAAARAAEKLVHAKEKLATYEAGGAPERPIDVVSPAQVEPHARSQRCARCDEPFHVDEHTAESRDGARLRVAHVSCRRCGARRAIYFRVVGGWTN